MDGKLDTMKKENEALWREVVNLRQKHSSQQKIVNKLIQFLVSIVQPRMHHHGAHVGQAVKRRYQPQLAIEATRDLISAAKESRLDPMAAAGTSQQEQQEQQHQQQQQEQQHGPVILDVTHTDMEETLFGNNVEDLNVTLNTPQKCQQPTVETPLSPLSMAMQVNINYIHHCFGDPR
jgi:heat shock transcription factor 1